CQGSQDRRRTGMEFLLNRTVVVTLAVLGALVSTAASVLQGRKVISESRARKLNRIGYVFMGTSMALFIAAGLLGAPE
ncbi:MAG: hypothetical protein WCE38_06115, partial [Burkholderiales bacterium]